MMGAIITEIPRDMCIGAVTTTGITLTGHTSEEVIIIIASIMTGKEAMENTIENHTAGRMKGPLITNSQRAFSFGIPQYFQHALRSLLLRVYPINHFTIAVEVNNNMFR